MYCTIVFSRHDHISLQRLAIIKIIIAQLIIIVPLLPSFLSIIGYYYMYYINNQYMNLIYVTVVALICYLIHTEGFMLTTLQFDSHYVHVRL